MEANGKVNFESLEDSCVDAINYLSFVVSYLRGGIDGQSHECDIFNRRHSNPAKFLELMPIRFRPVKELCFTRAD